jgi:hypothetical protein
MRLLLVLIVIVACGPRAPSEKNPPALLSWSLTPTHIDTSEHAQPITFRVRALTGQTFRMVAHVTDDFIGADRAWVRFDIPDGGSRGEMTRIDGGAGTLFESTLFLPRYSRQTDYRISRVELRDGFYRQRTYTYGDLRDGGITASIRQTGRGDNNPPQVVGVRLLQSTVCKAPSSAVRVPVIVAVSDDMSGIAKVAIRYDRGLFDEMKDEVVVASDPAKTSGEVGLGVDIWERNPSGTWYLGLVTLTDHAGRTTAWKPPDGQPAITVKLASDGC